MRLHAVSPLGETPWTENARTVLARRYLHRDKSGRVVETPDQMLRRVARAVAAAEARYHNDPAPVESAFYEAMARLELIPNSPTLMNAGRELGQLAACFVLPVEDSLPDIFDAVKWAALIHQTGGGTGFAFSRLRPSGDQVASTHGVASGPVSFIEVFNAATDAIRQGGVRRGANMGVLRVDHPDVLEFISVKEDPARLRNFNLSVAITDEFMHALEEERSYALVNPRTGKEVRRLDARKLWRSIAQLAWRSGEPGLIFIDRINALNPTPQLGEMESTNPCGELPLLPFESCNLASIDVGKLVVGTAFDWERMGELVRLGVRFLDNVIDVNHHPLPRVAEITERNRKIGLGIMGFADALIRLGVPYDSEQAVAIGDGLARFLDEQSRAASAELARERGPFANWKGSRWQKQGSPPLRNATTTTIAPTGTISILAGCSGGIEPLYAVSFVRQVLDGARLPDVHPLFVARAKAEGWWSEALMTEISERGSVRGLAAVPEQVQRLFTTAYDIAPEWHVRMQAAFQKHGHNAVSKTINFPKAATVEDVERAYRLAHQLGCKGVTVYRDGSREEQVLSFGESNEHAPEPREPAATQMLEMACPECSAPMPLVRQGACSVCLKCGYSRCL